ncbi:hypothetical protein [Polyangium aurulentum]|uniref:hypothetical protein n=1 Tax=Polyangium aurulentum TaxID=2567896 RepID=UPI0010AEAEE6|nr:hypothetical protein [Polyangium aurulentum]UQA61276.1 hypothetical protein E8A73_012675 [Polyangium aurulentum]
MLPTRAAPFFVLLAVIGLSPARAEANLAAPLETPGQVSGPLLGPTSPLVVEDEKLTFQCGEGEDRPTCTFEARYRISNPTAETHGGIAAFYGLQADGVVVRVNGRDARAKLSEEDVKRLDAEVRAVEDEDIWERFASQLQRTGFTVEVPAGGKAEIVTTGKLLLTRSVYHEYGIDGVSARHPLLHQGDAERHIYGVDYLLSPIRTWADVHRMEVSIRYPRSWEVTGSLYAGEGAPRESWRSLEERGEKVERYLLEGKPDPKSKGGALTLRISTPGAIVQHGGPFVGIGGVVGSGDAAGFRMRFGYEMAAPWWVIESISADVDFRGRVVVTPAVEAVSGQLVFLPSMSIGLGVPVQILPTPTVGGRILATLQYPILGFVTAVDIFPAPAPRAADVQVSLMARLSL